MKPLHVGILVIVAAVGGGLFTKWQTSRNVAPVAVVNPAAAEKATAPEKPAAMPAAAPTETSAQTEDSQRAHPSPVTTSSVNEEKPRKPGKARPTQPRMVAQSAASHRESVVDAAPESTPTAPPMQSVPGQQPGPSPDEPDQAVSVPLDPAAPTPPPPPVQVTLRAGMLLSARTVEGLSSERNQIGDTFTATLDQPLSVDGWVIAERGAHLEGKIVQSQRAGRVKGLSNLAIELTQLVTSDGQRVPIETETFEKRGESSTGQDAAKVGAVAAIGAAIGAIAGGGKGAGIGAAAGGAAGAGDVMLTRGKPAVLPAETHVRFRLRNSVTITERTGRTD